MNLLAQPTVPKYVLPLIVIAQFAGTSVWFAGNAVLPALQSAYPFPDSMLGYITTAVQLGFISGTLLFAVLTIADRFSPVQVFMFSALLASIFNLLVIWVKADMLLLLSVRFVTGFFLAGVYPVGMKIAADWYAKGLGKALGFLVGALVAGKAFPHLIKSTLKAADWQEVVVLTSVFAALGGICIGLFLQNGPHRTKASGITIHKLSTLFRHQKFKAAAMGYFGHMWELYTFWAFVPLMIVWYNELHHTLLAVSWWSFIIIGVGCISCIAGGALSNITGSAKIAWVSLAGSGICCLVSPLFFNLSPFLFLTCLLIWSCFVIADSPQFSALVSQTADPHRKGTALTLVTSIGFAITILSIEAVNFILYQVLPQQSSQYWLLPVLALGPVFGLIKMRPLLTKN
jgi:MFS family permease